MDGEETIGAGGEAAAPAAGAPPSVEHDPVEHVSDIDVVDTDSDVAEVEPATTGVTSAETQAPVLPAPGPDPDLFVRLAVRSKLLRPDRAKMVEKIVRARQGKPSSDVGQVCLELGLLDPGQVALVLGLLAPAAPPAAAGDPARAPDGQVRLAGVLAAMKRHAAEGAVDACERLQRDLAHDAVFARLGERVTARARLVRDGAPAAAIEAIDVTTVPAASATSATTGAAGTKLPASAAPSAPAPPATQAATAPAGAPTAAVSASPAARRSSGSHPTLGAAPPAKRPTGGAIPIPVLDRRPSGEAAGSSPGGGERAEPRSGSLDPAQDWGRTIDDPPPPSSDSARRPAVPAPAPSASPSLAPRRPPPSSGPTGPRSPERAAALDRYVRLKQAVARGDLEDVRKQGEALRGDPEFSRMAETLVKKAYGRVALVKARDTGEAVVACVSCGTPAAASGPQVTCARCGTTFTPPAPGKPPPPGAPTDASAG